MLMEELEKEFILDCRVRNLAPRAGDGALCSIVGVVAEKVVECGKLGIAYDGRVR